MTKATDHAIVWLMVYRCCEREYKLPHFQKLDEKCPQINTNESALGKYLPTMAGEPEVVY